MYSQSTEHLVTLDTKKTPEKIVIQNDEIDYGVPIQRTTRKRTISKTFQEDNSWN